MRVRNKPWAQPLIDANTELITETPDQFAGKWQGRFEQSQPIHVEIGTGKGQFIVGMAKAHPEINFVGVEIQKSVAALALKLALNENLPNLQLVAGAGESIDTYFNAGEVSRVYLNFSDPWPKTRHEKRRLTYKAFLNSYQNILPADGIIELKTDNQGFFEYSLMSLNNFGLVFDHVWLDLHNSEENENNVETEYEQKFSAKGQPIYKVKAHFRG
ncbi:tRNA (guanine-N(7)-)-methyltransferase [Paucilactobacillus hokkaidonensis JCM 18461]|uniref:tRNA (guanine-N(7)-)-methyltransferase n=2 Tax=Paucilactobacillus hokkaidonensis TaxID=1193095 RepID=A0A0A1GTV0_9LACO|nr:tRNA (guanosine(46)-N7)-methyltransferase TrmB [Paucilactobacillus hokkaidonensis]KRO09244.1 tRNA (guanine-N(7)-)-methyltransferase [Paucilactobacillus hokkaidonensis]BAP85425.1 tRNA (guanine-N(7)-)-methyltransferase [Paucilactobacillus hokkaidonensis JCM 18461]